VDSDFGRALAFEEALGERCAERTVPFRFGRVFLNDTFPNVWDLNYLSADRPQTAEAEDLAAEAERLQSEAGHAHRRITVPDVEGERLDEGFRALGWDVECLLFMVRRQEAARSADLALVEEVDLETLRPLRQLILHAEPWADSEEIVRQVLAGSLLVARAANARHFAVRVDGEAVSAADLYSDGRTAQVEDVATHPAHRARGYASAVVLRAVREAEQSGHDFVFLVTADDNWPKDLYARLGFAPLGREWVFTRKPAPVGRA
jgi:ribosomal protein S18 acetylase RimI-like enzyme